MDALFEVGTGKILTTVALSAIQKYDLDTQHVHHDTTGVTVYGDYDLYRDSTHNHPFVITRGFNKDHRPDLKQIIQSLVCVDRGIPVSARMMDGNRSDKIVNNNLLLDEAKKMKELGQNDPEYVADSAFVTEDNLDLLADEQKGVGS
jgi:transposase